MDSTDGPDRAERIRALFDEVVGLDARLRASALDQLCEGDAELRREVQSLLRVHDSGHGTIEGALEGLRARDVAGGKSQEERLREALKDRYRIIGQVGRGGMGTVYRAHDLKHGRSVAVKVFEPQVGSSVGSERFLREIRLTANLDHAHIVPLLDSGVADGMLYYVMPYVAGESLRDRLRREKQLSLDEAVHITRQIADALEYASGQHVVHRDIKPGNIMLSAGHARVTDFGSARALTAAGKASHTKTGFSLGTPTYMSPEQAAGDRDVDARSDVYSLACVTYEMLAGEPPHSGATPEIILARKRSEDAPSVRRVRPSVPAGVDEAIRKALEKVPGDRYSTAADFTAALEAGQQDPSPRRGETSRITSYGRGTLVGVALLLGAWVAVDRRGIRPAPIDSIAVLPCENLSGNVSQDYFVAGMRDAISNQLAQIQAIDRVISRSSVMSLQDRNAPAREIGRTLDVGALIECSVLMTEDRVQIWVSLIEAEADRDIWRDSYRRALEDIPALHYEIARDVAREIDVALTPEEEVRLATSTVPSSEAYLLHLKGLDYARQALDEPRGEARQRTWRLAFDQFEQAIDLDPGFAPAHASLAWELLNWMNVDGGALRFPAEVVDSIHRRARSAAEQAVQLDASDPEGHSAAAVIHYHLESDYDRAVQSADRALALAPGHPVALRIRGSALRRQGNLADAARDVREAIEIEPLTGQWLGELGNVYLAMRDLDQARQMYERMRAHTPQRSWGWHGLVQTHLRAGDVDSALRVSNECRSAPATTEDTICGAYETALFSRDYATAAEVAPHPIARAVARRLMGDGNKARVGYLEAVARFEEETQQGHGLCPGLSCWRLVEAMEALALAYASLGREAEALSLASQARELRHLKPRDLWAAPDYSPTLLGIWITLEDYDRAFVELEGLLSTEYYMAWTAALAASDPRLDPLKEDPRFDAILARY